MASAAEAGCVLRERLGHRDYCADGLAHEGDLLRSPLLSSAGAGRERGFEQNRRLQLQNDWS